MSAAADLIDKLRGLQSSTATSWEVRWRTYGNGGNQWDSGTWHVAVLPDKAAALEYAKALREAASFLEQPFWMAPEVKTSRDWTK